MIVCIAEDRESYETPLQILILSLAKHSPQLRVFLFYPIASAAFSRWLESQSQVTLCTEAFSGLSGWNIKPQAFLRLFNLGHEEVVWIDSDIIVTRDISGLLAGLDRSAICITEESLWGEYRDKESTLWSRYGDSGALRVAMWDHLRPGRALPHVLNSAVLRMTVAHRPLLLQWQQLLQSEVYRDAQSRAFTNRPLHLTSDQDVLTALLASSEFADIPICTLARGADIIQFMGLYGYPLADRIRNIMLGMPTFVHAQANKPWIVFRSEERAASYAAYIRAVYADTSPYTMLAVRYRRQVQGDVRWMSPHFRMSRILRLLGCWYPPLVGLPIACAVDMFVIARRLRRLLKARHLARAQ